jgi:hypothetical protein
MLIITNFALPDTHSVEHKVLKVLSSLPLIVSMVTTLHLYVDAARAKQHTRGRAASEASSERSERIGARQRRANQQPTRATTSAASLFIAGSE